MQHLNRELDHTRSVSRAVNLGAEVRDTSGLGNLVDVVIHAQAESWQGQFRRGGSRDAPGGRERIWILHEPKLLSIVPQTVLSS